jgi:hypothetical protein
MVCLNFFQSSLSTIIVYFVIQLITTNYYIYVPPFLILLSVAIYLNRSVKTFKNVRKSSYDWDRIADDYRGGMTLLQLSKKYGASVSQISYTLRARGVETRGGMKEWRKLQRVGRQRLVSLPYALLRQLGFGEDEELWYRWQPEAGKRMVLYVSRTPDKYRMYKVGATRIVRFKTDRTENLLGKWTVEDGKLVLTVKPSTEVS